MSLFSNYNQCLKSGPVWISDSSFQEVARQAKINKTTFCFIFTMLQLVRISANWLVEIASGFQHFPDFGILLYSSYFRNNCKNLKHLLSGVHRYSAQSVTGPSPLKTFSICTALSQSRQHVRLKRRSPSRSTISTMTDSLVSGNLLQVMSEMITFFIGG